MKGRVLEASQVHAGGGVNDLLHCRTGHQFGKEALKLIAHDRHDGGHRQDGYQGNDGRHRRGEVLARVVGEELGQQLLADQHLGRQGDTTHSLECDAEDQLRLGGCPHQTDRAREQAGQVAQAALNLGMDELGYVERLATSSLLLLLRPVLLGHLPRG